MVLIKEMNVIRTMGKWVREGLDITGPTGCKVGEEDLGEQLWVEIT